jgi:hypothetical protein
VLKLSPNLTHLPPVNSPPARCARGLDPGGPPMGWLPGRHPRVIFHC